MCVEVDGRCFESVSLGSLKGSAMVKKEAGDWNIGLSSVKTRNDCNKPGWKRSERWSR